MGFRYGLFISLSPIANCFASVLAYAVVHAKTSVAQWQLPFIIGECTLCYMVGSSDLQLIGLPEGIPTILIAPLAYLFLPEGPGECRFLTKRENEIVRLRALKARGHEEKGKLEPKQVFAAFYDYKIYFQAVIIFYLNVRPHHKYPKFNANHV